MKPKPGDCLTDWRKGQTFYVKHVREHYGRLCLLDSRGQIHWFDDCQAPTQDYDLSLNAEELADLVRVVRAAIAAKEVNDLLEWLAVLSQIQKQQLWRALSPQERDLLKHEA